MTPGSCIPNAGDVPCPAPLTTDDIRKLGTWTYDWTTTPPAFDGVESVPMIWSAALVGREISDSEYLLGFNEPDIGYPDGASWLLPRDGAVAWRELEQTYPDRKLVSPATVVNWIWLQGMIKEYRDLYGVSPRLDAVAIHVYDCGEAFFPRLQAQVGFYAMLYQKPLWITEMATESLDVMERALTWLEAQPEVERATWFMAKHNDPRYPHFMRLFEPDRDELTAYGRVWTARSKVYMPVVNG